MACPTALTSHDWLQSRPTCACHSLGHLLRLGRRRCLTSTSAASWRRLGLQPAGQPAATLVSPTPAGLPQSVWLGVGPRWPQTSFHLEWYSGSSSLGRCLGQEWTTHGRSGMLVAGLACLPCTADTRCGHASWLDTSSPLNTLPPQFLRVLTLVVFWSLHKGHFRTRAHAGAKPHP